MTGISTASPRLFWQGRDPASPSRENQSPFDPKTNVVTKRSSIEKLKQASRVKNSNIFAKEQSINYDPAKPVVVDRPLAKRPLSSQVQGNAFGGQGIHGLRTHNDKWADPDVEETVAEDDIAPMAAFAPLSPSKHNTSPGKSSLSKKTGSDARYSGFDPGNAIWADDDPSEKKLPEGRVLHRHAKSVTFDQAPPQVNEYEMTTPDPSSVASGSREGSYDSADEEDLSFERGSSLDRDDSFDASLEDTDKTPVVLPEDWRFMSPEAANTDLAQHEEDVFTEDDYGSPAPTAQPGMTESRSHQTSLNSVDSNGQARPLPPLPQAAEDFSSAIERMSNAQRSLPSPPKAISVSKSDIRRMSGGSMSLEERLRLMMLKEQEQEKPEAEKQRERRMRRAGSKDPSPTRENLYNQDGVEEDEDGSPGPAVIEPESKSPQISRESILRQLRSHQDLNEVDYDSVPMPKYDPDVPIPSLEDPTLPAHRQQQVVIKQEEANDDDLYSIPDMYAAACGDSESEETTSQYSQTADPSANPIAHENGQETPRARSPAKEPRRKVETSQRPSLPDFTDFGRHTSFDLDLSSYMTPPTELGNSDKSIESDPPQAALPDLSVLRASIQRPFTPQEKLEPPSFSMSREYNSAEPGTPDSVIRHPVEEHVLSEIASPDASVKAPGARLNIRPSPAPADTQTMAAVRRQVSGQVQVPDESTEPAKATETLQDHTAQPIETKDLPPEPETPTNSDMSESTEVREANPRLSSLVQLEIPRDQSDEGPGLGLEKEFDRVVETQKVEFELSLQHLYYPFHGRFPSSELPDSKGTKMKNPLDNVPILPRPRGARALPGDQPAHGHIYPTDGSLFANRSPYRQRGYLMRQNTKVVVASERASQDEARPTSSANLTAEASNAPEANPNEVQVSPRKTSQPAWTAEPWVGKSRRKSIRVGGETSPIKRKPVDSVAPPLPGQASNVSHAITEDDIAEDEAEDLEDGTERGRVFVKVVGVKDLDLPLPTCESQSIVSCVTLTRLDERTSFALTLDNGLHCVTTAWLDLAKKAPIGQEFELVVLNDLEFQLTLQMKLEEPRVERPASPTKALASPKKPGAFGRLFGSPKKRKESEAKAQQELAKRPVTPPSAYEMVKGLVAKDGSFARAYVALSEHEKQAYGRPYTVDIMCFNEWAMEEVSVGSSRSKKAVTELQRRPPYQIGKLELQLLYVPKPKGCKDEDMPKSMNSAVRELKEAETKMAQQMKEFEGHLSQQGGDCPVRHCPPYLKPMIDKILVLA